jgi:cell wall-associated NlpC family hydrolase
MTRFKKLALSGVFGLLLTFGNSSFALDFAFSMNGNDEANKQATPAPEQDKAAKSSWSSTAQEIILHALSQTGVKYRYGGINPESGFDCSGFVRYVFQQAANLTLPHGARAISQVGQNVSQSDLQPGDLVFFNTLKSVTSHVGIYVGNNRFIHSPSAGSSISVTDMNDAYWAKRYTGARRIEAKDLAAMEAAKPSN